MMATSEDPERMAKAMSIMERVPLIDGHNDFPAYIREIHGNKLDAKFDPDKRLSGQTDITRLRRGKVGGVFWSVFTDCPDAADPSLKNNFSTPIHFERMRDTLQQIDLVYRLIDRYPEHLEVVQRADDIMRIHKSGRIASLLGAEGLHQIANSASILRMYHRLGVRYVTLAHNSHNLYADCAAKEAVHGGLSEEGKKMVLEMNRIGMMVDLAHVSEQTMVDALQISKAPVAFTHSNAYSVCAHPRNAKDHVLQMLKKNNGIIMVIFLPDFVHSDPDASTIEHVVDHIMHIASQIGFDHIGVGSDYDGMPGSKLAEGLEDVSGFPRLVERILARGVSDADVEKILGLNVIRVLRDIEEYAKTSMLEVLEDDVVQWPDSPYLTWKP